MSNTGSMNFSLQKYTSLLLLLLFAFLFGHSEFGNPKSENSELHTRHDYCHLVDSTLPFQVKQSKVNQLDQFHSCHIFDIHNSVAPHAQNIRIVRISQNKRLLHNSKLSLFSLLLI